MCIHTCFRFVHTNPTQNPVFFLMMDVCVCVCLFVQTVDLHVLQTEFLIRKKQPYDGMYLHKCQELRRKIAVTIDDINEILDSIIFELSLKDPRVN